jgi:hypothetical protein
MADSQEKTVPGQMRHLRGIQFLMVRLKAFYGTEKDFG